MPQKPKYTLPIWSPELAYAIGLITTDGNLSIDKRHISFTSTDKDLIQTLLSCLHKSSKISANPKSELSKKPAYRTGIGDVTLYKFLESLGLTSNKSLTLASLKIPNEYFRDFLRGHLDGDGSIIHYIDRFNTKIKPTYVYERLFIYFISGSEKHIKWLRTVIERNKGINGSLNSRTTSLQKGKNAIWVLKFSTKQAKVILNWIYYKNDLPCLQRKYKIAIPYLENFDPQLSKLQMVPPHAKV